MFQVLTVTLAVAFSVSLATVIGQRLPTESVSVRAGAACGVGATIPASLLIVWAMRRRQDRQEHTRSQSSYPPVVIVQPPGTLPSSQYQPDYLPPYVSQARQRQFTVVGGNADDLDR